MPYILQADKGDTCLTANEVSGHRTRDIIQKSCELVGNLNLGIPHPSPILLTTTPCCSTQGVFLPARKQSSMLFSPIF